MILPEFINEYARMLWLKTFHILFVMSWMAGIFYLPRIFVHFVEGKQAGQDVARLAIMGRKLYGFHDHNDDDRHHIRPVVVARLWYYR